MDGQNGRWKRKGVSAMGKDRKQKQDEYWGKGVQQHEAQEAESSKKGLVIGIIVLVVILGAAAVAYNLLASGAAPQALQAQGSATQQAAPADNATDPAQAAPGDGSTEGAADSASQEKTEAPDFTMTSADGQEVRLSDFRGKPVILNFWASTCGPCKMEMPEFQAAFEQYGDQIQFLMVNIPDFNGETRERALQLIADSGYTFPVYFDSASQASIQYGLTSIPQTFFITADGLMEAYAAGAIDGSILDQGIDMLL